MFAPRDPRIIYAFILRAEDVTLLLDATQGLEHQDLKIASHVLEEGRALMIAINNAERNNVCQTVATR